MEVFVDTKKEKFFFCCSKLVFVSCCFFFGKLVGNIRKGIIGLEEVGIGRRILVEFSS